MKIPLAAVLMLGFPMVTGCATHWTLADRGQDAMDIFTASVGVGAAAQVKVGPIPLGLVQNADMAGIRNGDWFVRESVPAVPEENNNTAVLTAMGVASMPAGGPPVGLFRAMEYSDGFAFTEKQNLRHKDDDSPTSAATYQLEVVAGVVGTVRLGFNPGELLDFILGWGGIDIFHDDLHSGIVGMDSVFADNN